MQPPNQSDGRVARTRRCLGTLRPTPRGHSGGGLQTHTCPPRVLPGRLLPAVSGRLGPTAEADGVGRGAAAAWRRLLSPVLPRKRPHSPQRTLASPQTAQDPRSHATLGPSDCDQLLPSWDRRSSHLRGPAPVPIGEEGSQRQTTHAGAQSTPFMAGAHGVCQHPVNTHGGGHERPSLPCGCRWAIGGSPLQRGPGVDEDKGPAGCGARAWGPEDEFYPEPAILSRDGTRLDTFLRDCFVCWAADG